jgi:biopolymer transport protein ExbD
MAEIQSQSHASRKAGVQRAKRLSTRVDLTPMVDLGFLLITFFIFTTTLSQPQAMKIIIPADDKNDSTLTAESKTLNLILAADNKIHYYFGKEVGKQECTSFSPEGVRALLLNMQQKVARRFGSKDETVILIRPTTASSYMNLVDILDEIQITGIKKYALMDEPDKQMQQPVNVKSHC